MPIKWYQKGKLVLDESQEDNKLYVFKTEKTKWIFGHPIKVQDGYNYFIGFFEEDNIFLLEDITSPTEPVIFTFFEAHSDRLVPLTYTDIINIKLDNIWIINNSYNKKSWKYSDLKEIFSEEQIDFYK